MTSREIRHQFIEFFVQKHGHTFVPSSPVVPHDDPTLLFSNAGMNQFKPIFLGAEKREYTRAANTQKCIRAGGKHNDLDDVGKDTYHHTFFEMLGNWSFGDYFKKEAIQWAWELLTDVWKLDKSRLHVTVFMGDPAEGLERDSEAENLWKTVTDIDPTHIHLGNKKDNFWEMGASGPCGPCSEIHIDRTADKSGGRLVNAGDPRVMEIWNLVFIQYNRGTDGRLTPLPAKHIDTGMGFERISAVIQGKDSNYDTDVFGPIMAAIGELAGAKYGGLLEDRKDIAFRVIADHLRMSTFAIVDGAIPSNKGRGSTLRSVIRRAARFGYQEFKFKEPFLHKLVPVLVEQMGDAFPELKRNPQQVAGIIKGEEADFLTNLERGLGIFEDAVQRAKGTASVIAGKDVFDLHTTYGFFPDITRQLAQERGLSTDQQEYERLWQEFTAQSGKDRKAHHQVAVDVTGFAKSDDSPKYTGFVTEATVLGWATEQQVFRSGKLSEDAEAAILLDRTTFYAEQGGQAGDIGTLTSATGRFDVRSTERKGDYVLHWGTVTEGHIEANQRVQAMVDIRRADTMRNHTATHLLNWALRKTLGDHVEQRGSQVDPEKLRFDFSHEKPVTAAELAQVERLVNEKIYTDLPVTATLLPLADAKKLPGVRAMFGEKYPDPVRVIAIGPANVQKDAAPDHSIEFCGGTHLSRTGQAGFFKIVSEENLAKGIRRITAVTGRGAVEHVHQMETSLRGVSQALSTAPDQAPQRIAALQEEIKQLKKKLASGGGKTDPVAAAAGLLDKASDLGPGKLIVGEIAGATDEQLRTAMDSLKKKAGSYGIMLAAADEGKVNFVSAVSDDMIARGLKAGDWIRETAKAAGGGGGGRPQMAQAGGKDPAKLGEALEVAVTFAQKVVK